MRTKNIRLIATMVTLATAIAVATPADAQRRTSRSESSNKEVQRVDRSTPTREVKQSPYRKSASVSTKNDNRSSSTSSRTQATSNSRSDRNSATNSREAVRKSSQSHPSTRKAYNNSRSKVAVKSPTRSSRSTSTVRNDNRAISYNHSSRLNSRDKAWVSKHNKSWDRRWESHRWNDRSWKNYYNKHSLFSITFHKHYYHHPRYGHVIKRFHDDHWSFYHNHNRYHFYEGYFFRYRAGVGYVHAELPFGTIFETLPHHYDLVHVNGEVLFRVGNLFFERHPYGFRLVHFPAMYQDHFCYHF